MKTNLLTKYPPESIDEIEQALVNFSKGATDMVSKLLEVNPLYRLKSLHRIKMQPFFHGFDFSGVVSKKYDPNGMLKNLLEKKVKEEADYFEEFDGSVIV